MVLHKFLKMDLLGVIYSQEEPNLVLVNILLYSTYPNLAGIWYSRCMWLLWAGSREDLALGADNHKDETADGFKGIYDFFWAFLMWEADRRVWDQLFVTIWMRCIWVREGHMICHGCYVDHSAIAQIFFNKEIKWS